MLIRAYSTLTGLLVNQAAGHGLITRIQGGQGVAMPGLTDQSGSLRTKLIRRMLTEGSR